MTLTSATDVKYVPGVGPQRAKVLAGRGIETVGDLLAYLPFRYEDRIRFSRVSEVRPGGVYTVQGVVAGAGLARFTRGRGAIFHLLVKDETGTLPCKFFHGGYLEKRFREKQRIIVHGTAELDPYRPGRIEMINPQFELLGAESADSTEVGRIVPIYEAIGVDQLAHVAADDLCRARKPGAAAVGPAAGGHAGALLVSIAARRAAFRALSAAGRIAGRTEQFSFARAPAADFRGVLLLSTESGAAPAGGRAATPGSPSGCASRAFAKR